MKIDPKEYYETNENFKAYVDNMRRNHKDVSIEEFLEKLMVKEVSLFYQERDEQ